MRKAADLQDKVGQAEVDIPAREMLGDILLESHQPKQALAEYRVSLRLSPGRFNGLYLAGMAAEESGDKADAAHYYAALLRATDMGRTRLAMDWPMRRPFWQRTRLLETEKPRLLR